MTPTQDRLPRTARWIGFCLCTILFLAFNPSTSQAREGFYTEISPQILLYSGDAVRGTKLGGISYTQHFSRSLWVGIDFMGGLLSADRNSGTRLNPSDRFWGTDVAVYFNLPALLGTKLGEEGGLMADLYTSFGFGHFWLGSEKEFFGFAGGGMLIHTPLSWLTVRFDLKGIMFHLENVNGSDFNADMSLGIGPSIVF